MIFPYPPCGSASAPCARSMCSDKMPTNEDDNLKSALGYISTAITVTKVVVYNVTERQAGGLDVDVGTVDDFQLIIAAGDLHAGEDVNTYNELPIAGGSVNVPAGSMLRASIGNLSGFIQEEIQVIIEYHDQA